VTLDPLANPSDDRLKYGCSKDSEYLILVEEDWRGKNLLYHWFPDGRGRSPRK
jgi:hypothetical protein